MNALRTPIIKFRNKNKNHCSVMSPRASIALPILLFFSLANYITVSVLFLCHLHILLIFQLIICHEIHNSR